MTVDGQVRRVTGGVAVYAVACCLLLGCWVARRLPVCLWVGCVDAWKAAVV